MSNDDLWIIGITRFSVLSVNRLGHFRKTRDKSIEAARAVIHAPDRLKKRMCLFRTLAFPSLATIAAQHQRFHHIVITSCELPETYKASLYALASKAPWLSICPVGTKEKNSLDLRARIADLAGKHRRFTFRLDDDDALSSTYVDDVLGAAQHVPNGTALSFDDGYWFYQDRFGLALRPTTTPLIALGLGYLCGPDDPRSIFELGAHTEIAKRVKVHHITGKQSWLRTIHDDNDSRVRIRSVFGQCIRGRRLKEVFGRDFPQVDAWRSGLALSTPRRRAKDPC